MHEVKETNFHHVQVHECQLHLLTRDKIRFN